jgi:hypothetical protein
MKETAERRRLRRLACTLTAHYKAGQHWHPCTVLDLSEHGCRIRIDDHLDDRVRVQLRFETLLNDGARAEPLEVEAVVMWCCQDGLSRQAGTHFTASPVELHAILGAIAGG